MPCSMMYVCSIETLELFDEFEEWHMIHAHYHISVAANEPKPTTSKDSTSNRAAGTAVYAKLGLAGKSKDIALSPTHITGTPQKEAQLKAILDKRAAAAAQAQAPAASPT